MHTRRFALIAGLSLLSACGSDSPTAPGAVSGTVTFTYTGGGGGTYTASGALAATASNATAQTTTWATGWKDNTDNSINVAANVPSGSTSNVFGFVVNRQTVGTATIDPNCVSSNTTACTDVFFFVALNSTTGNASFLCSLDAGSVTIATVSASKVTGSFGGNGTCFNSTGATSAFVITNGSFDVPLLASQPGGV